MEGGRQMEGGRPAAADGPPASIIAYAPRGGLPNRQPLFAAEPYEQGFDARIADSRAMGCRPGRITA